MATLVVLGSQDTVERGGLGVVQVAQVTSQDKSQVSRLLKTLSESGLVERDAHTRLYRLGWQFFALAARAGDRRLLEAAKPILSRLVTQLGERVNLSVRHGREVLTVLSESPPHALQAAGWVGRTVPAYCTSSGRALLFDSRQEDLAELFGDTAFDRLGPNTPTTVDELFVRIDADRTCGYALVEEEFEPGLVGVAAPVRDFRHAVVAAVNVSAPMFRLGGTRRLRSVGKILADVAEELSALVGEGAASGIAPAAEGHNG